MPSVRGRTSRATVVGCGSALVLTVVAAVVTTVAASTAPPSPSVGVLSVAGLLLVTTVAGTLQLQLQYADEVDATDLFDIALGPVLFVLAPPAAVLLTVVGKAVSQGVLRVPPAKALFNVAQWACAASVGCFVLAVTREADRPDSTDSLPALALALLAVALVNHLAVLAVVRLARQSRSDDRRSRSVSAPAGLRRWLDVAALVMNLCGGLLLTAAYLGSRWMLLLALLPLVLLHLAQRLAATRAAELERVDELRAASRALLADDPFEALPVFLDGICRGLGAGAVELVLAEGDQLCVRRVAPGEPMREWAERGGDVDLLELREVLLVPPDRAPPSWSGRTTRAGHRNLLAAPLERTDAPRGVLAVYDRKGLRGFGINLRQVFEQLVQQLAGALARGEVLRRAEAERARFSALVRGSSDVVLLLAEDGTIRYASAAAPWVLGQSARQVTGRLFHELFGSGQSAAIQRWLTATVADSRAGIPLDLQLPDAGGLPRYVEAISRNLLGDPAVAGIVVNARDVSESRRASALMQRQAQVLELIAADAPLEQTLQLIADTIEEMLPAACCFIQIDQDDDLLPAVSAGVGSAVGRDLLVGERADALPMLWRGERGGPSDSREAPRFASFAADDGALPKELRSQLLERGVAAWWGWPLVAPGEPRFAGSLNVWFTEDRRPMPAEHRLVDLAAKLAANATDRSQERKRLAYQATHDALTGLASRTVLRDHIELALARMRRSGASVAVLFTDLDNFKIINDSLGHRVGDALLQEISRRLHSLVRPGDTVARLGGDEFVVLCSDLSDPHAAEVVAQRLLDLLAEVVRVEGREFFVTASLGIAIADDPTTAPDLLIENADAAMYRAKSKGGNRYQVFDRTVRTAAARRLATRTSLRQALRRQEFRVYYQPTVDLSSGRVRGVEALVRWHHPSRGVLPPKEFIPVAEETGMIVPLGEQVLHESCRQLARWRAECGNQPLEVSVNLSPRQFTGGDLVAMVLAAVADAGLEASSLSLEITETSLMEDGHDIRDALRELKQVGVRLAIDDFGTGYSSLAYLRDLPVNTLKLDQSFVRNVSAGGADRAIAEMVMGLGHTLGLRTVAEGIETASQLRTMRELGCEIGQGFLLGRPVPPEEVVLTDLGLDLRELGRPHRDLDRLT